MLTIKWLTEQENKRETSFGCVLVLGGFDGLHCGHQKLLARAKTYGLPVGIMTILGGKDGSSLFTETEREFVFKESGADFTFVSRFEEIKDMSPEAFANLLTGNFDVKAFVCGNDFRFGYQALGTPETLKRATRVRVDVEELLTFNGEKVSTSQIKTCLKNGEVEKANALLQGRFFLLGEVIKDRQVGRTLGFPTANIPYPQEKFSLKSGVYETRITVEEKEGKTYRGITNYGARPTFDDKNVLTETYLDGFSGDLYGKTLRVEFVRYLRGITRFSSAEALKEQLKTDIRRVREND